MIIVLLADGFEEIEALTPVDMLRRAGLNVKTVGVTGRAPTGAHGIAVICDATPDEIDLSKVTMAIFPGGMPGATNLDKSRFTDKVITAVLKNGGHLAAICAAPLIFGRRGLLGGVKATCYPGFEAELKGAILTDRGFVTDGNITTAKAMGSALDFSEELISICVGKKKAEEISSAIYRSAATPVIPEKEEDLISEILSLIDNEEDTEKNAESSFVAPDYSGYTLPSLDLLSQEEEVNTDGAEEEISRVSAKLVEIMDSFGVSASVMGTERGPRITRYEIVPAKGVKVNQILNLQDDIALGLGVYDIRMEAPIPGRNAIGVEIPNEKASIVRLRGLLETEEFSNSKSLTLAGLGKDVAGRPVLDDVAKMPHLLLGGSTGMGKSVCINTILVSMLYKASPDKLKLLLIDPKQVEFTAFKDIPHLLMPIISDPKKAAASLKWCTQEMERRYSLFTLHSVRNIESYNEKVAGGAGISPMPRIIIVIDELADLMLQVKDPIESLIMRIAQKARAAGIHMIIGTQRPSVNVITGVIKANIPSRLSCRVSSYVDSKTILDVSGAEKLLYRGDALYSPAGSPKPYRMQCAYVSDSEVEAVTDYIRSSAGEAVYDPSMLDYVEAEAKKLVSSYLKESSCEEYSPESYANDRQFLDAVEVAITTRKISTSLIQRKLSIGYGKAAKFIDIMEDMGIVSEANGQRPRDVLMTPEEWRAKLSHIKDED